MKNSPCYLWSQSWDKTECASFTLLWLGITCVLKQSGCRKWLAVGAGTNWPVPWPAHDTYDGEAHCLATTDKASAQGQVGWRTADNLCILATPAWTHGHWTQEPGGLCKAFYSWSKLCLEVLINMELTYKSCIWKIGFTVWPFCVCI